VHAAFTNPGNSGTFTIKGTCGGAVIAVCTAYPTAPCQDSQASSSGAFGCVYTYTGNPGTVNAYCTDPATPGYVCKAFLEGTVPPTSAVCGPIEMFEAAGWTMVNSFQKGAS
jgi:hypothetical protein